MRNTTQLADWYCTNWGVYRDAVKKLDLVDLSLQLSKPTIGELTRFGSNEMEPESCVKH